MAKINKVNESGNWFIQAVFIVKVVSAIAVNYHHLLQKNRANIWRNRSGERHVDSRFQVQLEKD